MKALRDELLLKQRNYRASAAGLEARELKLVADLQAIREAKAAALQCSQLIDETLAAISQAEKRQAAPPKPPLSPA